MCSRVSKDLVRNKTYLLHYSRLNGTNFPDEIIFISLSLEYELTRLVE